MVHSSRTGSLFRTKHTVPVQIFGWILQFKVHWQAKMHKSEFVFFFCYSNMCYDLKGNLDLSEMFLLNLMGGPVNQCGFHLLGHFTVNIHKNNFIEITAKGQARPNSAATFAHPSLKMGWYLHHRAHLWFWGLRFWVERKTRKEHQVRNICHLLGHKKKKILDSGVEMFSACSHVILFSTAT